MLRRTIVQSCSLIAKLTWDVNSGLRLPWDTNATVSAISIFDKDPPFVRADENFDPYAASRLSRTLKLSARNHV